jgi:phosphohistidine phosphatase
LKRLTLIRHAHAMEREPQSSDFERPLSRRGQAEAEALATCLLAQKLMPDLLVSSPAQRAKQTADTLARELALPAHAVKYEERLYLARPPEILRYIQSIEPRVQHLALVGHNPGLSELARSLAGNATLTELGTAVACIMTFDVETWPDITAGTVNIRTVSA